MSSPGRGLSHPVDLGPRPGARSTVQASLAPGLSNEPPALQHAGRRKEPFVPVGSGPVGLYVCGVTVYDLAHVGHARSALVFDVIRRYLADRGYRVRMVKNFTDVDDRIIARAAADRRAAGRSWPSATSRRTGGTWPALGVDVPDVEPTATEHIPSMIALIERLLVERGVAYVVGRRRLLRRARASRATASCPAATSTSCGPARASRSTSASAIRSTSRSGRRPSPASRPGRARGGRAGPAGTSSARRCRWSTSATSFDIHGGGEDLIFPHHENEIAQSEAATGDAVRALLAAQRVREPGRREDVQVARQRAHHRGPRPPARRGRHPPGAPRHALPAPAGLRGVAPRGGGPGARALPRACSRTPGPSGRIRGGPGTPSWTPCATPSGASARRWTTTSIHPRPWRCSST